MRVFADGAKQESPATLRFRVPSEKADATTVRVDVSLPKGVTSTAIPPAPGWKQKEMSSPQGVTQIMWTATAGHELKPDAHRYFDVKVGPLPNKASIAFDVAQTYSDGSVVNWNERQTGAKEPEFPAPVLVLDAAAAKAELTRQEAPAQQTPTATASPAPAAAAREEGAGGRPLLLWTAVGAAIVSIGAVVILSRGTSNRP
ncbi:DUF1775 domain-containing protein [Streptomyces sp. NPDC001652]|uniref:DUF1775 domain-containing protein n=1 Tax=Streptomyces sp. NPDC001652 TaxID=3154393 RepID=UPI00332368EC